MNTRKVLLISVAFLGLLACSTEGAPDRMALPKDKIRNLCHCACGPKGLFLPENTYYSTSKSCGALEGQKCGKDKKSVISFCSNKGKVESREFLSLPEEKPILK